MKSTRHVLALATLLVLASLAGCTSVLNDSSTTSTTPYATTSSPATTTAGPNTYALGETVNLTQKNTTIAVTVVDYRLVDSYEAANASGGGTHTVTAPDGKRFVFVKVRVENVGNADGSNPAVDAKPHGGSSSSSGDGPAATWMTDGWYYTYRSLPVGASKTGWVRATVADDVTASDVRVAFSADILITSDEYKWTLEKR